MVFKLKLTSFININIMLIKKIGNKNLKIIYEDAQEGQINLEDNLNLNVETVGETLSAQDGVGFVAGLVTVNGFDSVGVGSVLLVHKGVRFSLLNRSAYNKILGRFVHIKILASSAKLVKASGLIGIPPKLRASIHLGSPEGVVFNQKFAYNAARTLYSLFGGAPITSGKDLADRISGSVSASSTEVNMALNQHLVMSFLPNAKFDKSFITNVMSEVDYTGYNDGVTPLQFLEARTLRLTLGHILEKPKHTFSITAVNSDAPTLQQVGNTTQCYAVMKQPYNDFTFTFKVLVNNNQATLERFFDVKVSLRSPVEALSYTRGYLSVCSEFPLVKYNKNFGGQIGTTLYQKSFNNSNEQPALKGWKNEVKRIGDTEKDAQLCFMRIRDINDGVVYDPRISTMVPSYFTKAPLDKEFRFIGDDSDLIRNINALVNGKSYNIDEIIRTDQVVDVEATDAFVRVVASTLKPSIAQEIINNYFTVKTLSLI